MQPSPKCFGRYSLICLCVESLGLSIASSSRPISSRKIQLKLGNFDTRSSSAADFYSLTVDTDRELISVTGQTTAAVFYGIQTLVNLAFPDGQLAALTVEDWPRFHYRGLHVDVARNFHSNVTQMKKLIDVMATYKLNTLHFHLSDDEGWRLEIPGLPELTQVDYRRVNRPTYIILLFRSGNMTMSTTYKQVAKVILRRPHRTLPHWRREIATLVQCALDLHESPLNRTLIC